MSSRPAIAAAVLASAPRRGAPPTSPVTGWSDDMETNLYWSLCATGPDPVIELSATQHHAGAKSLHGKTRTTGAALHDDAGLFIILRWFETQALTLSAWYYLPNIIHLETVYWQAILDDGLHTYHPAIAWDMATGEGYYFDSTGSPIHVAALDGIWIAATWTHLTLVVNTQTKRYLAATAAAASVDLSGHLLQVTGLGVAACTRPGANASTADTNPAELYLDDVSLSYTIP